MRLVTPRVILQTPGVRARLLLGPAGSGKTFRCLTEARRELLASPSGDPLVFIAPRQATYQVERRLLASPDIEGYTRLNVLSFQRLPGFVFDLLQKPMPQTIAEDGRLMVLRSLLARHRDKLNVFRASARLAGFSAQLSTVLEEFERNRVTPALLREIAEKVREIEGLNMKVADLATMLGLYANWLAEHELKDADSLLGLAAAELNQAPPDSASGVRIGHLWVDGFAEFSPQEMEVLAALAPHCGEVTVTFCLDRLPREKSPWLSSWSVLEYMFFACRKRLEELPGMKISVEMLERKGPGRFAKNAALRHLERHWSDPIPFETNDAPLPRILTCKDPEAEAVAAAREILKHVRAGGRYREAAVLVRKLSDYHAPLHRAFTRYGIPFFIDRREPVAHHPAVELTRSALRTVTLGWLNDDLFAALKTGLIPVKDELIDSYENEALARGWRGATLKEPVIPPEAEAALQWVPELLGEIIPPFDRLERALAKAGNKPNGVQLASALRRFWSDLGVEEKLKEWSSIGHKARTFNLPPSVHTTVWEGLGSLLENMELAFRDEPVSMREWLPILEAAFSSFSVGIIPPALDQVLIGTMDRSRDPEIKIAIVLGMNEGIFPALPEKNSLLTESDRAELEKHSALSAGNIRFQLGRERFYAYLACTRASERLVLTFSSRDTGGKPLNPSPFLAHFQRLFPSVQPEDSALPEKAEDYEHICELAAPLLKAGLPTPAAGSLALPGLDEIVREVRELEISPQTSLSPEIAGKLYGPVLRTSVSRFEQYAACPFKFFVHSGLRAQERKQFELDIREQGSFQHDALALFHEGLRDEGLRWRDLTPAQARIRIGQTAEALLKTYRDGLFQTSERSRFMGQVLTASLQDFVETLVEWMREQYLFDPAAVELPFGDKAGLPPYEIDLGAGKKLAFKGRIDRVDLFKEPDGKSALCVVVDYKSSQKKLDPVLLEHGLQLQLTTYLNVLRALRDPEKFFGVKRLIPAGVFYVSLRGKYPRKEIRDEALQTLSEDRKAAYKHSGRYDSTVMPQLDARPDAASGHQFAYRRTKDGALYKNSVETMEPQAFAGLLNSIEANLKEIGSRILSGHAEVSPYRKGTQTACDHCEYQPICRVDRWTQQFRILRPRKAEDA